MRSRLKLGTVAFTACAALVLACGVGDDDPQGDTGYARPMAASSAPATVAPVDPAGEHGDGTFEVPAQLAVGKWATTAPADGYGCYWARRKDASGQVESIIANGFVGKGAPGIMQIAGSDKFVEFSGGCRWRKTG